MNADLLGFLQGVSRAGAYESTGTFTVDVVKMRMKLRSQFLHPTHSILSCVRAGVTSGARQILIAQAYETTRVELQEPRELLPRALLEGVLGRGAGAETERLLGAAFQGAFANGCLSIAIDLPGARVVLTPETMEVEPTSSEANSCTMVFRYGRERSVNRRRCLDESLAVTSRAAFCPVPLVLDGIPVNEGLGWERLFADWQRTSERYGVHPDFVWLEAMLTDIGEPFPVRASGRKFRQEFVGGELLARNLWDTDQRSGFVRVMPKLQDNRRRAGSLTRLGSSLEGPGRLYPIKQGVVLEPVEESLGAPAVGIVVRVDHLETDMSLFQLVRDDSYQQLINSLRVQTRALVQQFGRSRKAFILPRKSSSGLRQALVWGGGTAVLMAPSGLWGSLLGGLAACGLVSAVHAHRFSDRALVEREQRIRWILDDYVDKVAGNKSGPKRLRL